MRLPNFSTTRTAITHRRRICRKLVHGTEAIQHEEIMAAGTRTQPLRLQGTACQRAECQVEQVSGA